MFCVLMLMTNLETNKRLEEELEVYGSGLKTSVQLTSYTFEVCLYTLAIVYRTNHTIQFSNDSNFQYVFQTIGMRFVCKYRANW